MMNIYDCLSMHMYAYLNERINRESNSKQSQQAENIQILHHMNLEERLRGIESEDEVSLDVWVVDGVVGVYVVLNHMLVDPLHGTTADPVLAETETD